MFRYIATQSSHCIRGKYAALQSLASLLCDIRPEFGRVIAAPREGSCDRLRSAAAAHCTAVVVFGPLAHPSAQRPHQSVRPSVRGLALAVMSAMSVCGERAGGGEGSNFPGERMREPKFLLALLPPYLLLLLRPTGPKGAEGPKSQIESRGSVDRGLLRIWTCGAGKQKGAS